jgi:hypothetical protein
MLHDMKFKDMKIGDRFECWGDLDLGAYEYPKTCLVEKTYEGTVTEIKEDGSYGENIGLPDSVEFDVIATNNPDALKTYRKIQGEWVTIPETPNKKNYYSYIAKNILDQYPNANITETDTEIIVDITIELPKPIEKIFLNGTIHK